jgi:hypothetical protein
MLSGPYETLAEKLAIKLSLLSIKNFLAFGDCSLSDYDRF